MRREPAGYRSPGAFRRALTDRLRAIAAGSRWALPHLQRQFAYDLGVRAMPGEPEPTPPLTSPDRALWKPGYAAEAGRSRLPVGRTLNEALAIVGAFVDPLLDMTAAGTWAPNAGRWQS
jgi:hypothetical protein